MKKAQSEMRFVVFLVVFIAVLGIIGSIFGKTILDTTESASDSLKTKVVNEISKVLNSIPVVSSFWNIVKLSFGLQYVNPYISILVVTLIAAPFGYILLRLLRGGG